MAKKLKLVVEKLEEDLTPIIKSTIHKVSVYKEKVNEKPFTLGQLVFTKYGPGIVGVGKGWAADPYTREAGTGNLLIWVRPLKGTKFKLCYVNQVCKLVIRDKDGTEYDVSPSQYGHVAYSLMTKQEEPFVITRRGKAALIKERANELEKYNKLIRSEEGFVAMQALIKANLSL